jgi:hypothetical protein
VPGTWEAGYPFPRPSGPLKAAQIMVNVEKRYQNYGGDIAVIGRMSGYDKNLKLDFNASYEVRQIRLSGRAFLEPHGFIDALAQKRGESKTVAFTHFSPRDVAGVVQAGVYYLNPDKADNLLLYIPSLRRVRKMTASDTQDPIMGQDLIYDDNEGWLQKLSATRYPYKFELVEEREFLVPAPTVDGAEYISSNNVEFRNVRMERRPLYVVKMTQLDPTYVYGQRIFYVDKETFLFYHIENYDQKGRLYRTWDSNYGWHPDMGIFSWCAFLCLMRDHIDLHSGVQQPYVMPALWERKDLSIEQYINAK